MVKLNPWTFGAVLSITVVVNYILCTIFWFAFPGPSLDLINGLFHEMDFRKIHAATPFSAGTFAYVLVVLAAWSCGVGAVYAAVRNWLKPETGKA